MTNIRIWVREYQYLCPNTGVKKVGKINFFLSKSLKIGITRVTCPSGIRIMGYNIVEY